MQQLYYKWATCISLHVFKTFSLLPCVFNACIRWKSSYSIWSLIIYSNWYYWPLTLLNIWGYYPCNLKNILCPNSWSNMATSTPKANNHAEKHLSNIIISLGISSSFLRRAPDVANPCQQHRITKATPPNSLMYNSLIYTIIP